MRTSRDGSEILACVDALTFVATLDYIRCPLIRVSWVVLVVGCWHAGMDQ